MDEKQQQVARQAIQRKPLQRKPLPNFPPGGGNGTSSDMNRQLPPTPTSPSTSLPTGPPPAYEAHPAPGHTSATAAEQQFARMQLNDAVVGANGNDNGFSVGVGVAPARQGTNRTTATTASTATTSTAVSSSSARTQSTAMTSPTTPGLPPLPARPSAGAGQFAPGIVASPGPLSPASTMNTMNSSASASVSKPEKKEPSIWKTALDETRFFAGGLLTKPYESTKHYTVMRHSAGLVMYRGPTTNVVVTVFSTPDHPISPADRTVWLQRRGYSGDTGLKLKTLVGASGSWLDVTPERQALPTDLPTADERGYQRDIAKLMKKTSGKHMEKALAKRQPRETLVVRIPAACADGYFRLVVCSGGVEAGTKRKVLCGSPVFRVASTSTDASIFRGASLSTLPMEAGVKIASFVGNNYVTNMAAPVVETVQGQISKYQPGTVSTMAAQTAYDNSKLSTKVDEAGQTWEQRRETSYQAYDTEGGGGFGDDDAPPEVLGADSGPTAPFPLQFQGRIVRGTGRSTAECGVPTANLGDVPDDVRLRLRGVYFGWATLVPGKNAAQDSRFPSDWIEAVVTVGSSPWGPAKTSVVSRNDVVAHLLYDFGTASLLDAKLKVILMGFVRPLSTGGDGAAVAVAAAEDASLVVSSLSRPAWGPQATLARMDSDKSSRSLSDKYVDTRGKIQKQVDRIPIHWAGVRTEAGDLRDQLYGNGGFWVKR
ncbi:hypothetical protein SBRCBS47491_004674 [Sporothrix bragantina]|uniref:Riboflavin kinase n=1 Tax=Sporothrix bragantina TaxID=671064 RepID=A0ABP0BR01_9PEZI